LSDPEPHIHRRHGVHDDRIDIDIFNEGIAIIRAPDVPQKRDPTLAVTPFERN
jgi:hypothetical protein